jgi:VanZ family protein
MALIWGMSTDIGSAAHTGSLFNWLARALVPWATPAQVDLAHFLVRKLGHLAEYAVLAALWVRALHVGRHASFTTSAWTALAISVGWAALDELHQLTVASRTASPVDVAIDTAGALLAVLGMAGWAAIRPSGGGRAYLAIRPRTD